MNLYEHSSSPWPGRTQGTPRRLAKSMNEAHAHTQHVPQSQSFSRSYGSNLPTSLTYMYHRPQRLQTFETGCGYGYGSVGTSGLTTPLPCFQGPATARGTSQEPRRSTAPRPYRLASSFQGHGALNREENSSPDRRQRARVFSRYRECRPGVVPSGTDQSSGISTGFPFSRAPGDHLY